MAHFHIETFIAAPPERCFDLSLDIDFHVEAFAHTGERAVAGCTTGQIGPAQSVTWEARHLGMRRRMTVTISAHDRPRFFRDEMTQGPFAAYAHDHRFQPTNDGTLMIDDITFASPLGIVGRCVDATFLRRYMQRLIVVRNAALREKAEATELA